MSSEKWAIVMGAAGAIGSSLSEMLRGRTVKVAGLDIAPCPHSDLVSEPVDICDRQRFREVVGGLVEALGPPDVAAHVAGVYPLKPISSTSDEDMRLVLETNLVSAANMCQLVLPAMERRGHGRLLLVTSQAAVTGGTDAIYASSKAGLVALGKSLAREHGRTGIRVNMISPGPVDTPMADVMPADRRAHYELATPIGRFAQPDEVAAVGTFVLLDAPDALHGATIDVDGGLVRR